MTAREKRESVRAEIPVDTKEALKDADGAYCEVIDEALRMFFGLDEGSTEHALERMLEQKDAQIDEKIAELEQGFEELDRMYNEREELEQKLADIREKKQTHNERLDAILDEMVEQRGKNVLAWMGELKEAAREEYGTSSKSNIERVVGDLRSRRDERGLAIVDHRFQQQGAMANQSNTVRADGGEETELNSEKLLEQGGSLWEGDD